jgi:lactate permease
MSIANLPPFLAILLAAAPILVVMYLMIVRHWGGSKAGPAGWLTATAVALLFFGATPALLLVAWGKAVLLALFVLYIIWMALLLYHTVNDAGAISAIGQQMPGLAQGRGAQALLLAWIFGAFIQGATGFGVPAAVVAPLLMGVGFAASTAVVIALLGHAWAVSFGSLGSAFISLVATTGVSGEILAGPSAALMAVAALGCGLAVLWLVDGGAALKRRGLFVIVMTVIMGGSQYLIAKAGLYPLAALGGGLAGLAVAIPWLSRESSRSTAVHTDPEERHKQVHALLVAFIPYAILIAVVISGQLLFEDVLNTVQITYPFPETCTTLGFCVPAGDGRSVSLFGHGGALLLYATILIFLWYRRRGTLPTAPTANYSADMIVRKTVQGSIKPTIGVYALVAMALTMEHAGMTQLLASVLSGTGVFFPLLSPLLGALGAFMTGSNTNSNVIFGQLQMQTAVALSLSVPLILAAQTAGGAIGSSFAPAKVIVGASTVPGADEGDVLRRVTVAGLAIIMALGVVVWLTTYFLPAAPG